MNNDIKIHRLYIKIDGRCNLHCVHCSDFNRNNKTLRLEMEALFRFYEMLTEENEIEVIITGGEPSLHPNFVQIVEYFAKVTNVTITTNGTIISSSRIISLLEQYKNITLQISMDGITKETFEFIRGKNTFRKVNLLLDEIARKKLNRQVGISMVILASNYFEIDKMINFCEGRKYKYLYFPTALPSGNLKKFWNKLILNIELQKEIYRKIFTYIASNKNTIPIHSNYLNQICSMLIGENNCFATFSLKINPEGYLFSCPAATNKKYIIGRYDIITLPKLYLGLKKLKENTEFNEKQKSSIDNEKNICVKKFCTHCSMFCEELHEESASYYDELNKYFIEDAIKELE